MPHSAALPYDDTPAEAERRKHLIKAWASAHFWTIEEGMHLAWNIDPRVQEEIGAHDDRERLPPDAVHLITLGNRSPEVGESNSPRAIMDWAHSMGVSFHDDWYGALEAGPKAESQKPEEPKVLMTTERETLLRLLIGMAMGPCYGFDPDAKRNEATSAIQGDLDLIGIKMTQDTILKWLRVAADEIEYTKPVED